MERDWENDFREKWKKSCKNGINVDPADVFRANTEKLYLRQLSIPFDDGNIQPRFWIRVDVDGRGKRWMLAVFIKKYLDFPFAFEEYEIIPAPYPA